MSHEHDGIATGLRLTVPSDTLHEEPAAGEFLASMIEMVGKGGRMIGEQLVEPFPSALLFEDPGKGYFALSYSMRMGNPNKDF